jgi:arylformamidase
MPDYIDITVPLVPGRVPLYPGDTELVVERAMSQQDGSPNNVSRLVCSMHGGTHVDGAVHFIEGASGVEAVPLDALIGPAVAVDATHIEGHIDAAVAESLPWPDGTQRVLVRTRNSRLWDDPHFTPDFTAFTADGARVLVDRGVRLVGVDGLSVAPYEDPTPAHVALLTAGVAIVETLDLRRVAPGPYHLWCLPLLVPGADGAPARAVVAPA